MSPFSQNICLSWARPQLLAKGITSEACSPLEASGLLPVEMQSYFRTSFERDFKEWLGSSSELLFVAHLLGQSLILSSKQQLPLLTSQPHHWQAKRAQNKHWAQPKRPLLLELPAYRTGHVHALYLSH